jgi:hypothetical protein
MRTIPETDKQWRVLRPGKARQSITVPEGSTVEDACLAAGFAKSDFRSLPIVSGFAVGWPFRDQNNEYLPLASKLCEATTHIIGLGTIMHRHEMPAWKVAL